MQLMTFNSLLMFDIVFVFFLFLVGVTCLVYYLPPGQVRRRYQHHHHPDDEEHQHEHQHSADDDTAAAGDATASSMGAHCAVHQHQHHHQIGPVHSSSYHELCSAHRALKREHGFAATVVLTATPHRQQFGDAADEATGYSSSEDGDSGTSDSDERSNASRRRADDADESNADAASASTLEFFTAVPPPQSFCTYNGTSSTIGTNGTAPPLLPPPPPPPPLSPSSASLCGPSVSSGSSCDYCESHSRPAPLPVPVPVCGHCQTHQHQHQHRMRPQPQCCYVTAKGIATGRGADPVQHV